MIDPVRNVRWSSEDVRFIRELMEAFADPAINEIVVICSAQSAKTLTMLAAVAWIICEDPGPLLWVTANDKEAKKHSNMRLYPLLEKCAPVAEKIPTNRQKRKTLELYLPGMPLVLTGAENTAALQSTPYRYVICDEARSYKKGTLGMISKRFRSYGASYKKIIITTPANEFDEVHLAWLAGDQRRLLTPCPKCGFEQEISDWGDPKTVGGLKWDKTPETYDREREEYRWEELFKTIRYHCWNPECDHVWRDNHSDRKEISRSEKWVSNNPNAPSNVRSYTWAALVPWWPKWDLQVREFLEAKKALQWGNPAPLRDHMTETRGLVWRDSFRYAKGDKHIEARKAPYDPRALWPEELKRFMTIDVQGKGGRHFKWVIRAWGAKAWSRKLAHGVAYSFEELQQIATDWNVPAWCVAIDSGTFTSEVYGYVVRSGGHWKAMKGDDRWTFRVDGTALLYQITDADPAIGTVRQGRVPTIPLWVWAKYGALDRLLAMQHGFIGQWEVESEGVDDEYALEVTAIGTRTVLGRKGDAKQEFYNKRVDDHFSDCEQMQIICSASAGLLNSPAKPIKGGDRTNPTSTQK